MSLESLFKEIKEHPAFQRLNGISQLGVKHLIYPNFKNRTRMDHSERVADISKQITQVLEEKGCLKDESEINAINVAALLHDIGHPPFSHTGERIWGIKHKEKGIEIMERWKDKNGNTIDDILRKYKIDPELVKHIIKKEDEKGLWNIVGGKFGADKLEYVLVDSKNFADAGFNVAQISRKDIEEMINALYYDTKNKTLCFESGVEDRIERYQKAYVSLYYDGIFLDVPVALERIFEKHLQNSGIANNCDLFEMSQEEILEKLNLNIEKENLEEAKTICRMCYEEVKDKFGSVDMISLCNSLEEKFKENYGIEVIVAFVSYRGPELPKIRDENGNITEMYGNEYKELIKKANENSGIRVIVLKEREDYGIAIKKGELKKIIYSLTEMPGKGKCLVASYFA